jgi:hypothetical protein
MAVQLNDDGLAAYLRSVERAIPTATARGLSKAATATAKQIKRNASGPRHRLVGGTKTQVGVTVSQGRKTKDGVKEGPYLRRKFRRDGGRWDPPHHFGPGPGPDIRTGSLKKSIGHTPAKRSDDGKYEATVHAGGPGAPYAAYVENGSSRWPAGVRYPFFGPGVEWARRYLIDLLVHDEWVALMKRKAGNG